MYAIVESGNKQYKIRQGDVIDVELLHEDKDNIINLEKILLLADEENIVIGTPFLNNSTIKARVLDEVKDDKVISFKYKNKTGYHKTKGHRQKYTRIKIEEISLN